ncbi:MAG: hypothetical protein ACRCZF_03880, partial [Gemmataceae bacterium]
ADGNIMAWSVPEGRPVWTAPARHMSRIAQLGYDRTGTRICSCSEDNTARIWDPTTGTPRVPPIRLGATASNAAFNDDGRLLYTELPSGKARIWDSQTGEPITPVFPARADWAESVIAAKWPVEDMLAGGRMLSGQRLTESGDVIPTDANAMRDDWRQLKNRYSVIAQTEPKVLNKWRERQTSLAEKRQEWFSAGWHLVRLIEAHPQEPSYRRRAAAAAAKLGDWSTAAANADRAVRLQPEDPDNWYQRGEARGRLQKWDQAAVDLAMAIRLRSDPATAAGLAALVALEAKDYSGYKAACAKRDDSRIPPGRSAWLAGLAPQSGIEPAELIRLAGSEPLPLALALIRSQKPEDALALLKEDRPVVWALRALALAQASKPAEAKPWREKA